MFSPFHIASFLRLFPFILSLNFSTALRAETPGEKILTALPYKAGPELTPYETERCRLDLHLPVGKPGFPTLVWFHGGALTGGIKDDGDTRAIARHFAASGVAVAAVNYRLSPKVTFPAYLEDAAAAFAWTKEHIAGHGGNPDQVFIGGHSAGGYLALMVGLDASYLRVHGMDISHIAGIVPVAGQTLTHYTIREERGLAKERLLADAAAPVNHVRKDAPPLLILYAEKDMAMRAEENELLAAALRNTGHTRTTIRMIPGKDHGSVGNALANAGDKGFAEVMKFITGTSP